MLGMGDGGMPSSLLCPSLCLSLLRSDEERREGQSLPPSFRLHWTRVRDALYQHGERHFPRDEGWWREFDAFEESAARAVLRAGPPRAAAAAAARLTPVSRS